MKGRTRGAREQSIDWETIESAEDWGRRGLSAGTRAIGRAALEAFLCDRRGDRLEPPGAAWRDRVLEDYDLSVGQLPGTLRFGIRLMLRALEWLPLANGKLTRMSRLPLGERVRYFEALERHPVALLTMMLVATKVPMTVSAYERGEPLRMTGFDRKTTTSRRRLPVAAQRQELS